MPTVAEALPRAIGTEVETEALKMVLTFCGLGLAVSLVLAAMAST